MRELVPESHAYMDLVAFEQKLDATISRKRLDIQVTNSLLHQPHPFVNPVLVLQEALKRPLKVRRRLRIYVSHTFFPGKEGEGEAAETSGSVPMWELRVEGRLLDEAGNTAAAIPPSSSSEKAKKKFSTFFKSLVIELDKDIYGPDNHLVEVAPTAAPSRCTVPLREAGLQWHRTPQTKETDGFQVKRPGDQNVKCTILLLLDHQVQAPTSLQIGTGNGERRTLQPMKFKLNASLAKLLGVHTETRPKIIEALWQYVKNHKLQDQRERDHINCDSFLERVPTSFLSVSNWMRVGQLRMGMGMGEFLRTERMILYLGRKDGAISVFWDYQSAGLLCRSSGCGGCGSWRSRSGCSSS